MKRTGITFILLVFVITIMAQELKPVAYNDGNQRLNGMITSNTGQKLPGVLILPAWQGVDNEAKNAALALAAQGYVAFIADIYGEGNVPADFASAGKMASAYKQDYKAYQHRIKLALDEMRNQGVPSDKIAVIGYCFGGTGALEAARAGFSVQGVVSIHGGLSKDANRPNIEFKTKILVEHPAEDKSVSQQDYDNFIKEMREGNADWQIIVYANCGHTFTNPESGEYNELMANRAWKHTLLFLEEVLK